MPWEVLAEALWPGRLPADTPTNIRILVNRARRALGDPTLILTGPGGYAFAADDRCSLDAEMFLARVEEGRRRLAAGKPAAALTTLRGALELWAGDPLAEDFYEEWAQEYRSKLARAHADALETGAAAALAFGDAQQAVGLAELAVAGDPLREAAHLLLVRALAASGDRAAALAVFDRFRRQFADELGLDPSPEALELQTRILRGEPVGPTRRRAAASLPLPLGDLAFVGRERELQRVLAAVAGEDEGVAILSGPSGAGKSRLLTEIAARSPVPVVSVRAFPAEQEEAWGVGRALLREVLNLHPDAARAIPDRAAQALADIVPELEELRPIGRAPLDAETRRALALEGGVRLVEAGSARGALILADDLQWADATSLVLLGLVVGRVPGLGSVLAYRPEELGAEMPAASFLERLRSGLEGRVVSVTLGALPIEALALLLADRELAEVIAQETDLRPFTVAETIRMLAGEGEIEPDTHGRWRARTERAPDAARRAAREGQRRAIRDRSDRLPETRRNVLHLLALLEREVPARLLAAAARRDQAGVLEDLDALAHAGLVGAGEGGWAPAHALIGETISDSLDRPHRLRLHQMLARALEEEGAEPAERARHLAGAGDRASAADAFAAAARQWLDSFATEEAEGLANAGLELEPKGAVRSALLDVRAEARARKGDVAGARTDLRALLATKERAADRARILARIAYLTAGSEDYVHASELAELALAEAGVDPGARGEALAVGAIMDLNTNRLERAEARCLEALALFEEIGDARGVASVLDARAILAFTQGRIAEAVEMFDRVARLFQDWGQLLRVGAPRYYRALGLVLMGDAQTGLCEAEEAIELEHALGHPEGEVWASGIRCLALAHLGRTEEAVEEIDQIVMVTRQLHHRELIASGLLIQATVYEAAGDLATAEACLRQCVQEGKNLPIFSSWAAAGLARLLVLRGDFSSADVYLAQALTEGVPFAHYDARLARAELAHARADPAAPEIAAEALALAESGGHLVSARRLKELVANSGGPTRSEP